MSSKEWFVWNREESEFTDYPTEKEALSKATEIMNGLCEEGLCEDMKTLVLVGRITHTPRLREIVEFDGDTDGDDSSYLFRVTDVGEEVRAVRTNRVRDPISGVPHETADTLSPEETRKVEAEIS